MESSLVKHLLLSCMQDPKFLEKSKEHLSQYDKQTGFHYTLLQIVLDPSCNFQLQKFSSIVLKNLIKDNWQEDFFSHDEKKAIRDLLIKNINLENYTLKNSMARIAAIIAYKDFPNIWDGFLNEIVDNLQSDDLNTIDASLRTLIMTFEDSDDRFHIFVPKIFVNLFSTFIKPEITAKLREKCLHLMFLCVRTFAWADDQDNELVHKCFDETFHSWIALFVSILQSNPKVHYDIKKEALKILTVIFRDFARYSRESINTILQPAWKLLNLHLPFFTEVVCYGQTVNFTEEELLTMDIKPSDQVQERGYESDDEEESYGVEGMTVQLIDLITTIVGKPGVYSLIESGVVPLVSTVASYLLLTKEQEHLFSNDPNMFIADDEDEANLKSIRNACLNLLSEMINIYGDRAVEAVLFVAEKFLLAASVGIERKGMSSTTFENINVLEYTYDSEDHKHPWKKREAGLLILGTFAEDIEYLKRQKQGTFDIRTVFEKIILVDIQNAQMIDFIKGRSLWCAAKLSALLPNNDPLCVSAFELSYICLSEKNSLPVRLSACRAIVKFLPKTGVKERENKTEILTHILTSFVEVMAFCSQDTVHIPLGAFNVLAKNDEASLAQIASHCLPKLLHLFKLFHNDPIIGPELLDIFKVACGYETCLPLMIAIFTPFIADVIKMYYTITYALGNSTSSSASSASTVIEGGANAQALLDSSILMYCLELLSLMVQKANPASEEYALLADVLPLLMEIVVKSEDLYLLLHGAYCLKTYAAYAHSSILDRNYANGLLEATKKLLKPTTNETTAANLGSLIIHINAKTLICLWEWYKKYTNQGCPLLFKYFSIALTEQNLVLVFARIIHTNPKEIISFLSSTSIDNRISLKIILDKWLLHQPLFRGTYTKNTTFGAILKLFTLREPTLETLMVIGYNPSHTNINSEVNAPFKILSVLLRYLDNELNGPTEVKGKNDPAQKIVDEWKMKREADGSERMDTIGGDDDDYDCMGTNTHEDEKNKIEVNLDDIIDEEEEYEIGKNFAGGETKDRGLADLETGSEVYMTEMLNFEYEPFDENEEVNEDDLKGLGDDYADINLQDLVQDTLITFTQKNPEYFHQCLKHLTKEDQTIAKNILKIK